MKRIRYCFSSERCAFFGGFFFFFLVCLSRFCLSFIYSVLLFWIFNVKNAILFHIVSLTEKQKWLANQRTLHKYLE